MKHVYGQFQIILMKSLLQTPNQAIRQKKLPNATRIAFSTSNGMLILRTPETLPLKKHETISSFRLIQTNGLKKSTALSCSISQTIIQLTLTESKSWIFKPIERFKENTFQESSTAKIFALKAPFMNSSFQPVMLTGQWLSWTFRLFIPAMQMKDPIKKSQNIQRNDRKKAQRKSQW